MEYSNKIKSKESENFTSYLESIYPHNVLLYIVPPDLEITLEDFKELAVDRLKVLRILERASSKNLRIYSKEWKDAVVTEFNSENLKGYSRLLLKGDSKKQSVLEVRKRDYISHFILRLIYCATQDQSRWFIQREMELFRLKLLDSTSSDIKTFLKLNELDYSPIKSDEKDEIRDGLNDSTMNLDATKIDVSDFYKVPFLDVLDLIRHRRCYVKQGFAYVSSNDFISVLATKHQEIIEKGLQFATRILPYLEDDERFVGLMKNLHTSYTGKDYAVGKNIAIPIESLDQLSKKSFALCMRHTHETLRAKHHLKYGGRLQYALYLKGIGVTLEDALRFWREEFCKIMDSEKFDKAYAYGVKHSYGKVGSMKDYSPFSCQKIINTSVGPQDTHGCPFKIFEPSALRSKLSSYGIGLGHIQEVLNFASKGHFQLACGRYFEITHETVNDQGINHPNQYFEMSQEIMGKRGGAVKNSNQTPNRTKFKSSQMVNTQNSTMDDSSIMEELLNTPMEFDSLNY